MNTNEPDMSRFEGNMDTSVYSNISNPESSLGRLSTSTLSMRNKKQRKKHASAHHNSNLHAGYVPVTEEVLHKSGIRGRKRYFLYCTLAVLMFVAFINMLVTAGLLYILGMTHNGLGNMEIVILRSKSIFHSFVPTFASSISMNGAPLGAFHDTDIRFTSKYSPMYINSFKSSSFSSNITLNENNITVFTDKMLIKSEKSKQGFSLNLESVTSSNGISNFVVQGLIAEKVQNMRNINDLYLESHLRELIVNGSMLVDVRSSEDVDITARDILLESKKNVVFQSKHSIYLDPNLPKVYNTVSKSQSSKICICGNGRLFMVPVSKMSPSSSSCNIGRKMARKVCLQ